MTVYYPLVVYPQHTMVPIHEGFTFGATVSFMYRGPAVRLWTGIGLAFESYIGYNPPFIYAKKLVEVGPTTEEWVRYDIPVEGVFKLPEGHEATGPERYDSRFFVCLEENEPVANKHPSDDFGVNNWDDEIFYMHEAGYDYKLEIQQAIFEPEDGEVKGGDVVKARVKYRYMGPACVVKTTFWLVCDDPDSSILFPKKLYPVSLAIDREVPECTDWEEFEESFQDTLPTAISNYASVALDSTILTTALESGSSSEILGSDRADYPSVFNVTGLRGKDGGEMDGMMSMIMLMMMMGLMGSAGGEQ